MFKIRGLRIFTSAHEGVAAKGLAFLPEIIRTLEKKNVRKNYFESLDSRQGRDMIHERKQTNEEIPVKTPAYYLERVLRLQCKEGKPKWNLAVSKNID